jgi:RNA polymerase sigma-70 factor (ECF subfamily)
VAQEPIPDLGKWVEKAQAGDSQAFAQVYDALVKPIYRYIYYRVEESIAEDLTEETFLRIWQNLDKYKKESTPFASWAFRIAHNLVVDHYRKNQSTDEISEEIPDTQDHSSPEKQANLKLTQVRLRKIIRKLPDNYQQIIILKYINDFDNRQIAESVGKTEGAVRILQFRALEQLRGLLTTEQEDLKT